MADDTNRVRFIFEPLTATFKVLFNGRPAPLGTPNVAMRAACCCDRSPNKPGYAIPARDCCTGAVYLGWYLDLTRPPEWAFTKTFYDSSGNRCFHFHVMDLDDAVPIGDPSLAGASDFLADSGALAFDRYASCNACRCDHSMTRCCYDYIDYPDADSADRTDGRYYITYAGVTPKASLFTCRSAAPLTDPVTGDPLYAKVDSFSFPTGPYTYSTAGNHPTTPPAPLPLDLCPTDLHAEIQVTTRYFTSSGCTPGTESNRAPSTGYIEVTKGYLSIPADACVGLALNQNSFETDPYPPTIPCAETVLSNKWGSGDSHAGYGGTVTITPCCPGEDGGI